MSNEMYSKYAKEYAEAVKENLYNALYERPSLLSMLPSVKGLSVLDLGCGSGIYSKELLRRGATVTAIDSSNEMISIVKADLAGKLNVYTQDLALGLPLENSQTYDLVISPLVIHYIKDLKKLFSEVARVLKAEGTFLFSTHHPMVDFEDSISGNYFETEMLTQYWNTIGSKVKVKFYRRPMTELFLAIETSGMNVVSLKEGFPDKRMKTISEKTFNKLTTKPGFIFIKCKTKGK